MELRDYLRILRRGWPLVVAFVVIGLAAGIGITLKTTKVYEASVQLFVGAGVSASPTGADLNQNNLFAQQRVQSYTNIANSPDVTKPVVQQLGIPLTAQQLGNKITADAPQNKVLINLHVTDHNPKTAARLANAVAAQFATVVEQTDVANAGDRPVVHLTVIHPATIPSAPIKPNKVLNIGLGFVIGLLIGIGVVVLRDVLDNTVKGPSDFEELGVPVLGMVPLDKRTQKTPVAFRADPHGLRSEAYRQLRTNLQFVNVDAAPRIIAVTSAVPGEGKSTTAINLAAALAEGGYRVCLIEADLRRPTLSSMLGLVPDVGFTTVLIGQVPLQAALQNAGRNLAVLTSGPVPPNPSEVLISDQARRIIQDVADHVDYTIIDTAPLLPVADGAEVAAMADATLVVHRAGKTSREQALRSITALEKVGERPVGVILNMISRSTGRYDYEYNYYYTYRPDRSRRGPSRAEEPLLIDKVGESDLVGAEVGAAPVAVAAADLGGTGAPGAPVQPAAAEPAVATAPVDEPAVVAEQPVVQEYPVPEDPAVPEPSELAQALDEQSNGAIPHGGGTPPYEYAAYAPPPAEVSWNPPAGAVEHSNGQQQMYSAPTYVGADESDFVAALEGEATEEQHGGEPEQPEGNR